MPERSLVVLLAVTAPLVACGARSPLEPDVASDGGAGGAAPATSTHASTAAHGSTGAGGQGGGGFDGSVVSVDPSQSFMEAETSLSVHGSTIVASWIAISGGLDPSTMGYAVSLDAGATWTAPAGVSSPNGRDASDPVVAADAAGNFHMAFVGFQRDAQGNPFDMHVYVAELPAGATTFGPPIEASDPSESATLYDKPWITVTGKGTIVVSYANFDASTFAVTAARSVDGVTFQRANIVDDPTFAEFSNLAFLCSDLAEARVYAVYATQTAQGPFEIRASFSDDEGASWSPPLTVAGPASGENVAFDDPTCVAVAGELSVLYGVADGSATGTGESEPSVALGLAHVTGGAIASRTHVEDPTAGTMFLHASLAGDATGALTVAYYAGQFDGDDEGSYRVGPVTWNGRGPTRAYRDPIRFTSLRGDPRWLGDYTGVAQSGGDLYTTFVVNEPTESHVAFARVPIALGP